MIAPADQLAEWLAAPAVDHRTFEFTVGARPELVTLQLKEGIRIVAHVGDAPSPQSAIDIALLVVRGVPV